MKHNTSIQQRHIKSVLTAFHVVGGDVVARDARLYLDAHDTRV